MSNAKLIVALSTLSGRSCTRACLMQNRSRFYVSLIGALSTGLIVGSISGRGLIGSITTVVLVVAGASFLDRRIVGVDSTGVVQATSSAFRARPVAMLPPLPITAVEVLHVGERDRATFRLDGKVYLGMRGSKDVVSAIRSQRAG